MKKIYFGSNLKMYKTIDQTIEYLSELDSLTGGIDRDYMDLFIIPSYMALPKAAQTIDQKRIRIGAQNMSWEDQGQYTGEISPLMLEAEGINFVMVGHSERRHLFKETDADENKKVQSAIRRGFRTLLCIGETAKQKEYGIAKETLQSQLRIGLHGITKEETGQLMIAYEPVWSIGVDGVPASSDYVHKMHAVIKDTLKELFSDKADQVPVLYGGSVNKENAVGLAALPSVDGLFVGRAAWDAHSFADLIHSVLETL